MVRMRDRAANPILGAVGTHEARIAYIADERRVRLAIGPASSHLWPIFRLESMFWLVRTVAVFGS